MGSRPSEDGRKELWAQPAIPLAPEPCRLVGWLQGFCHGKNEMKSKISIWDCRRAIEIKGGLPLTIRGALFVEPEPDPVANFLPKEVFVTQLEVKQGRWIIGNIGFTRSGQEYLTKLARDIIADDDRLYASQQSDLDPES